MRVGLPDHLLFFNISFSKKYSRLLQWAFAGGANWPFGPRKLDQEPKIFRKSAVSILIPINLFNSCNKIIITGMALTLHKSQIHCTGVMQ